MSNIIEFKKVKKKSWLEQQKEVQMNAVTRFFGKPLQTVEDEDIEEIWGVKDCLSNRFYNLLFLKDENGVHYGVLIHKEEYNETIYRVTVERVISFSSYVNMKEFYYEIINNPVLEEETGDDIYVMPY